MRQTSRPLDPFAAGSLDELFHGLRTQWDDIFGVPENGVVRRVPRMVSRREEEDLLLEVELPGVAKESIEVELLGRVLSIAASRKSSSDEGEFTEAIAARERLPKAISPEAVTASYADGLLSIRLTGVFKVEEPERSIIQVT